MLLAFITFIGELATEKNYPYPCHEIFYSLIFSIFSPYRIKKHQQKTGYYTGFLPYLFLSPVQTPLFVIASISYVQHTSLSFFRKINCIYYTYFSIVCQSIQLLFSIYSKLKGIILPERFAQNQLSIYLKRRWSSERLIKF